MCLIGQPASGKKSFVDHFLLASGLNSELPLFEEERIGGLKTSYRNWTSRGQVAFTIIPGKQGLTSVAYVAQAVILSSVILS